MRYLKMLYSDYVKTSEAVWEAQTRSKEKLIPIRTVGIGAECIVVIDTALPVGKFYQVLHELHIHYYETDEQDFLCWQREIFGPGHIDL